MIFLPILLSFVIGCVTATHIYSKRNKTVLRLKNINRVAQNLWDGEYGSPTSAGAIAAIAFIMCESDLSLVKGRRKNET